MPKGAKGLRPGPKTRRLESNEMESSIIGKGKSIMGERSNGGETLARQGRGFQTSIRNKRILTRVVRMMLPMRWHLYRSSVDWEFWSQCDTKGGDQRTPVVHPNYLQESIGQWSADHTGWVQVSPTQDWAWTVQCWPSPLDSPFCNIHVSWKKKSYGTWKFEYSHNFLFFIFANK